MFLTIALPSSLVVCFPKPQTCGTSTSPTTKSTSSQLKVRIVIIVIMLRAGSRGSGIERISLWARSRYCPSEQSTYTSLTSILTSYFSFWQQFHPARALLEQQLDHQHQQERVQQIDQFRGFGSLLQQNWRRNAFIILARKRMSTFLNYPILSIKSSIKA